MTANLIEKRKTGNLGEDLACRFLIRNGFSILERNYLKKCGEIDIIAKKESSLHFIEVKSVSCETIPKLSSETAGDNHRPEDNIHTWKLARIAKTLQVYLSERNVSGETNWQFDVITVKIDVKRLISRVLLLENIIL